MHMGDADPDPQHFAAYQSFFADQRTGIVIVPFWFLGAEDAGALFDKTLNAQSAVGVHVPVKTPASLAGGEWEYFNTLGQQLPIPPTPQ